MKVLLRLGLTIVLLSLLTAFSYKAQKFELTEKNICIQYPSYFPKPVQPLLNKSTDQFSPLGVFKLGKKMFYDDRLSRDHSVSCASCHQQIAAFAHSDHKLSHGIYGKIGTRNIPTLQNLAFKKEFMADGGIHNLKLQALAPLISSIEMDQDLPGLLKKINADSSYRKMFSEAFKRPKESKINTEELLLAIQKFVVSLGSYRSKYDDVRQNKKEFSTQQARGYELVKKHCSSCHEEPLFSNLEVMSNGLGEDSLLLDKGRFLITQDSGDLFKFQVPSLRNEEMSYPYMHDGRLRKLKEVVEYYVGKERQFSKGTDVRVLGLPILNMGDKKAIIEFLKTLTDYRFLRDRRFAESRE
ncbi:c-type cytochrome [Fibrobacterales bacterium]|nr:c-type cytochrome [Fibrobacterales bacterium]